MIRRYKKFNRRVVKIGFFLFGLMFLGGGWIVFSPEPEWVKPAFGGPTECAPFLLGACDALSDSELAQLTACDLCGGESCENGTCVSGRLPCPGNNPDCYQECVSRLETLVDEDVEVCAQLTDCLQEDSFCEGLLASTECRVATCLGLADVDPDNPTGCDFSLVSSDACELCEDFSEGLDIPPPCGNGICEPGVTSQFPEGESCATCPEDCLLPGFQEACPLTSGEAVNLACGEPQAVSIQFGPYNVPASDACEDGDLCTDNQCQLVDAETGEFACLASDKSPDANSADFCCPSGAVAPLADGSCPEGSLCDVDCYVPQECVPPPPPPSGPVISGSGCSLNPGVSR